MSGQHEYFKHQHDEVVVYILKIYIYHHEYFPDSGVGIYTGWNTFSDLDVCVAKSFPGSFHPLSVPRKNAGMGRTFFTNRKRRCGMSGCVCE